MPEKPSSLDMELTWEGDLRFSARSGNIVTEIDADGQAGFSPVQALALALAGCMSTDVVKILKKARQPLRSLEAHFSGTRAPEEPRRFTRIDLRFVIEGEIPQDRIEHAIALSRQTYCSVWHSLRPDIELTTRFEIAPGSRTKGKE